MNEMIRRNWLFEGEAQSLGDIGMNAANALMEAFDRSSAMWEQHPPVPQDPMALVDLADAARDLSAKALILLGVQHGNGPSARMVEFAARHRDEALAALREGRPLPAEIVNEAHREWKEYFAARNREIWSLTEAAREMEMEEQGHGFAP